MEKMTISDLLYAITGFISIVGSIAVYAKMSYGKNGSEEHVKGIVLSIVVLCLVLIVVSTLIL